MFRNQVEENLNICSECDHHFYVPTASRIQQLLDLDSFEEWYADLRPVDPLKFADRKAVQRTTCPGTETYRHDGGLHSGPRLHARATIGIRHDGFLVHNGKHGICRR